ncbi:hypothetical protein [Halobacillus sp. Marseille-Q1614]|uniref:hypothetical protein n=1 Tax=Halobacillus sp. Marseille-Q1614 TaxID=2709134 RepID=UPI00156F76CE|nr:hypothetical protein [Halobacillus sp. Marseille-Q1614]
MKHQKATNAKKMDHLKKRFDSNKEMLGSVNIAHKVDLSIKEDLLSEAIPTSCPFPPSKVPLKSHFHNKNHCGLPTRRQLNFLIRHSPSFYGHNKKQSSKTSHCNRKSSHPPIQKQPVGPRSAVSKQRDEEDKVMNTEKEKRLTVRRHKPPPFFRERSCP